MTEPHPHTRMQANIGPADTAALTQRHYFFAGGGTGGHIYPGIAVAQKLKELDPGCEIVFFCSRREIDAQILSKYEFEFLPLPAQPFSKHPKRFVNFFAAFMQSYEFCKRIMGPEKTQSVLISIGGYASAPAIMAAGKLRIPAAMINVDMVPGRANRFFARFAKQIFVQFEETAGLFPRKAEPITVTGCPLRKEFDNPNPQQAVRDLDLDPDKRLLLVTGASSGAVNINNAMADVLPALEGLAQHWQIVHLAGTNNYQDVRDSYSQTGVDHVVLDYYENMASLMAAADIVIGRGGGVSVAEYAATGTPAIIMPYPYHKDRHQYRNARPYVETQAALIVEDTSDTPQQTTRKLAEELLLLMEQESARRNMHEQAMEMARKDAAMKIAETVSSL